MSKTDSKGQEIFMSYLFRGTEIFKPAQTGVIDERVKCLREYVANIFFYTKEGTTIMIDAGYNYDRLKEKMAWLDLDPAEIRHILITHQDTDHVGAVEDDSDLLFKDAKLYIGEIENRYLTGEEKRMVMHRTFALSRIRTSNEKVLLKDGEVFYIDSIKVECILVPGHTWGHMVYLIDDKYLFTGDTIWFGADGGYSFIAMLAEDNNLSVKSLAKLEHLLVNRNIYPKIITGHTGWTSDRFMAFAHRDRLCIWKDRNLVHDPEAPFDGYDESDDTENSARSHPVAEKQFIR